jgi:dephospho-CoA kinase
MANTLNAKGKSRRGTVAFHKKNNTKSRFIVCLTGMPGAGKSTVADSLVQEGFSIISMGNLVRDEAKRKNIKPSDINLGNLMIQLRNSFGAGAVARLIVDEIEKRELAGGNASLKIVVDGVRSIPEVRILKTAGRVKLLAIHASTTTRFEHLRKRQREDAPLNRNDFCVRDKRELAVGISEAIALADETLSNNSLSVEELRMKAVEIVQKWVDELNNDDHAHLGNDL